MTASSKRVSRFLIHAAAYAVCLLLISPGLAAAQTALPDAAPTAPDPIDADPQQIPEQVDETPIPLVPETAPVVDAEEFHVEDTDVPPAFQVPAPDDGLTVSDLPSARPSWTGVLTETEGGLGWAMWEGTDAALAGRLLAAVPEALASPAMRNLTLRLLLSRAAAPEKPARRGLAPIGPDGNPVEDDPDTVARFLEERIHLLVRLADGEGLGQLADALPVEGIPPELVDRLREARILAGDGDRACPEVRERLSVQPTFRLRMSLVACQIRQGTLDAARLTLQLLEDALPANAVMPALAHAILDGTPLPGGLNIPDDDYLALVLLAHGDERLARYQNAAGLPVYRAIAESKTADTPQRIYATEQAARAGALRDLALVEAYAAVEFTPEQLRSAGTEADGLRPVLARALLFQAALQATTAIDRARFLRLLWDRAGQDPGFTVLAHATGAVTATVSPRQDLAWFSVAAARGLLAGGRYIEAEEWVRMLASSADLDFVASGQLYALFPALALAGRPVPEPFEVFPKEDIRATLPRTGTPAHHATRLSRLLVVLEAMDVPVPMGSWLTLLDDAALRTTATIPSAPTRYQLRDAVTQGRKAETVLFVLSILGPGGPAAADPLTLNAAIRSLRAIGLTEDARAIALEAVI